MKVLLSKEIKSIFCSSAGLLFVLVYSLALGLMLWLFPGRYNIIDGGYATLSSFFHLAPMLLLVLVPALTMGPFADERNKKTLDILLSRPVRVINIYLSKFLAIVIFLLLILITTTIYVYSVYQLGNPVGNIDLSTTFTSYLSLLSIILVFVSIGLFASSLTSNQIVAFVLALILNLLAYYGFDLLGSSASTGRMHNAIASLGVIHHYQQMQRGVVELCDIMMVVTYLILFFVLTLFALKRSNKKNICIALITIVVMNIIVAVLPSCQIDFTIDKRYALNAYTTELLSKQDKELKVTVYLAGDLNSEFQYLHDAIGTTLTDLNRSANNTIHTSFVNPYSIYSAIDEMHRNMSEEGMQGIVLNEVDREGKTSQKVIYPYAKIENDEATLVVSLLKNVKGYTASENINASIEDLEFEFVDAIRLLQQKEPKHIAFVEGHGELPRKYLQDTEEILSKYYFINRGEIEADGLDALKAMDALIIAGPTEEYTDGEKYLIDQYIMSGGRVLWLLDGARYSQSDLMLKGHSASMKNETNLDDILFAYGVRVNSDLVQDAQSTSVYLMSGKEGASAVLMPNLYAPLLIPSLDNPITKNIQDVKAGYVSSIDFVNNKLELKRKVLLTTSENARLIKIPELIDFDLSRSQNENDYFDQSFVPIAVSLEGVFISAFNNRMIPEDVETIYPKLERSEKTKMIVVGNSQLVANEIERKDGESGALPLGYDRASKQMMGNRDFLINAVNWLTGEDGWMELRGKKQEMRTLNRKKAFEMRDRYAAINIISPILICLLVMGGVFLYRKRKYTR